VPAAARALRPDLRVRRRPSKARETLPVDTRGQPLDPEPT